MTLHTVVTIDISAFIQTMRPSRDGAIAYYPCQVTLKDGSYHPRVYLVDGKQFDRTWGVISRPTLPARDIVAVAESPERLPVEIADTLYEAGESGMGYCRFVLEFRDGRSQEYVTGNAIDFLEYPEGLTSTDVRRAVPHQGRMRSYLRGVDYEWCPVTDLAPAT